MCLQNPDGIFPGNLLQVDKMMIAKFLVKTRCNITTLTRKVLQIESKFSVVFNVIFLHQYFRLVLKKSVKLFYTNLFDQCIYIQVVKGEFLALIPNFSMSEIQRGAPLYMNNKSRQSLCNYCLIDNVMTKETIEIVQQQYVMPCRIYLDIMYLFSQLEITIVTPPYQFLHPEKNLEIIQQLSFPLQEREGGREEMLFGQIIFGKRFIYNSKYNNIFFFDIIYLTSLTNGLT